MSTCAVNFYKHEPMTCHVFYCAAKCRSYGGRLIFNMKNFDMNYSNTSVETEGPHSFGGGQESSLQNVHRGDDIYTLTNSQV